MGHHVDGLAAGDVLPDDVQELPELRVVQEVGGLVKDVKIGLLEQAPDQVELLALVGAKEKWDRRELEAFAAERGMLLDGALEALNEAALDKCGQSLFEGEDPVEVSLEVWKELAP